MKERKNLISRINPHTKSSLLQHKFNINQTSAFTSILLKPIGKFGVGVKKSVLIGLFLMFPFSSLMADGSGASFLKIPVGAKAVSLGSAFTAVANDVSAIYWNPGCLARLKNPELGFMHTDLYGDTKLNFLGYVHPTQSGNFGLAVTYLTQEEIQGRDSQGQKTSGFSASDMAVMLNYSRFIGNYGLGVNLKLIQQKIADASASGLALDFGASYRLLPRVQVGFAVLHLGPRMKFINEDFNLPLSVSAGAAYIFGKNFLVSADLKQQVYEKKTSFSIGMQFQAVQGVFLRTGYLAAVQSDNDRDLQGLGSLSRISAGFGLKLLNFMVDYSFVPMGEIGNAQRISLGKRF